ncbi:MAG: hypothetical protein HQ579_08245, partial [Candidatus Omnitrophica bacterium]|nr:hypothetical protein [Candidatus Omnitrophota bacterium]
TVTLTDTTGAVTFGGSLTAATLNTQGQGYSVLFNDGGTITNDTTFANTGGITFGDNDSDLITFNGGLDTEAGQTIVRGTVRTSGDQIDMATVTLNGATTLDTTNNGGSAGAVLNITSTIDGTQAFVLDTGNADISIGGAIGATTTLGAITINAADNVDVGSTINATSLTQTAGTGQTNFDAAVAVTGNADITTDSVNMTANGSMSATNITLATKGTSTLRNIDISNDFALNADSAPATYNVNETVDVDNNVTIAANVTLGAGDSTWTISGDMNKNDDATFTPGTSEFIFDDASKVSHLYGTDYYDLTCETPGKEIQFEAGSTKNVSGTLTLKGEDGTDNYVVLRSTEDGQQWNINPSGARDVNYVDIQDSVNLGAPIDPPTAIDRGNNVNWWTDNDAPEPPPLPELINDKRPIRPPFPEPSEETLGIPEDGFVFYEEKEDTKKYGYAAGKYRTVIIVYEGKVVVALPYDKELELNPGDSATFEGEIKGARLKVYGFNFAIIDDEPEKLYKRRYIPGMYQATIMSIDGKFYIFSYNDKGPDYSNGIIINTGETIVRNEDVK